MVLPIPCKFGLCDVLPIQHIRVNRTFFIRFLNLFLFYPVIEYLTSIFFLSHFHHSKMSINKYTIFLNLFSFKFPLPPHRCAFWLSPNQNQEMNCQLLKKINAAASLRRRSAAALIFFKA